MSNFFPPSINVNIEENEKKWQISKKEIVRPSVQSRCVGRTKFRSLTPCISQQDNVRRHVYQPVNISLWNWLSCPTHLLMTPPVFWLSVVAIEDAWPVWAAFRSFEEVEICYDSWLAPEDVSFPRNGIHILSKRWGKVVTSDGQYFE